jgi:hypothetical protein
MATGMGLDMLRRGRMDLTPRRIKQVKQLQAILEKAEEIGRIEREQGGIK